MRGDGLEGWERDEETAGWDGWLLLLVLGLRAAGGLWKLGFADGRGDAVGCEQREDFGFWKVEA